MPTASPPRDRVTVGFAAIAAGALIAATVALVGGGTTAPEPTTRALLPAAMDTDGDGVADGTAPEDGPLAASGGGSDPAQGTAGSTDPGPGPGADAAGPEQPPASDGQAPDGAATPIDAVRDFIAGLGAGDTAKAWQLMHPRYRDAFDSYADFAGGAPTARFGPFAALGGAGFQSAVFDGKVDGEAVAVVSVLGAVARGGAPATEAVSLVAREAESGWLVEVGGEGGSVFQSPAEPGGTLAAGDPIVVWTPSAGVTEVLAVVDGEARDTEVTELADPSETAEIRVSDRSTGGQQAAIGVLREDGSVDTVATHFVG